MSCSTRLATSDRIVLFLWLNNIPSRICVYIYKYIYIYIYMKCHILFTHPSVGSIAQECITVIFRGWEGWGGG
jgi:hypothetical protein